jgi:hypothetical protein
MTKQAGIITKENVLTVNQECMAACIRSNAKCFRPFGKKHSLLFTVLSKQS